MKKIISILLTLSLAFSVCVFASAETVQGIENGFSFTTEDDGADRTLVSLDYIGTGGEVYIPDTLGGAPLQPADLRAGLFSGAGTVTGFRVSPDSETFSVSGQALLTADGKTLVLAPTMVTGGIFFVPAGVERMAQACFDGGGFFSGRQYCIVIPESVTEIESLFDAYWGFFSRQNVTVAGMPGSAAEAYAENNNLVFLSVGEGHTHGYYRSISVYPTCTAAGSATLVCPCGDKLSAVELPAQGHDYRYRTDAETGERYLACANCGDRQPVDGGGTDTACTCPCHQLDHTTMPPLEGRSLKDILTSFLFHVRLLIWRLTGTHKYCECGARHY
ncbi:MAG: hypothetical protein IJK40_09645 [Clostridia bacterium]|nr:hypothetical protein [Clostridia bacterium]